MRTLDHAGLDPSRVRTQFDKMRAALGRDDFRSADLKKLAAAPYLPLYRAKLDDANRLLLTFLGRGDETCALRLEVVEQHAYEKSRFLRRPTPSLTWPRIAHAPICKSCMHARIACIVRRAFRLPPLLAGR